MIYKYSIIFDTNSLIFGNPFRSNATKFISEYKNNKKLNIKYYIAEVTAEEIKSKMPQRIFDAKSQYSSAISEINGLMRTGLKNSINNYSDEDIKKATDKAFKRNGIHILKTPKINFDELLQKAIYHKPPFSLEKDSGLKDEVIARTILSQLSMNLKKTNVVFICNDDKFRQYAIDLAKKNKFQIFKSVEEFVSELKLKMLIRKSKKWIESNLKDEAEQIFFKKNDFNTLFYKAQIEDKIYKKYAVTFSNPTPTLDYGLGYVGISLRSNQGRWIPIDNAKFDVYKPLFIKINNGKLIWESRIEYSQKFENVENDGDSISWMPRSGYGIGGINPTGIYNVFFVVKWTCDIGSNGKIDRNNIDLIDIQQNRILPYIQRYEASFSKSLSMPTTISGTATAEIGKNT